MRRLKKLWRRIFPAAIANDRIRIHFNGLPIVDFTVEQARARAQMARGAFIIELPSSINGKVINCLFLEYWPEE